MKSHYFFSLLISFLSIMTVQSQLKAVTYHDGNQQLEGFSGKPVKANAKKAGVLILPAWMGVDAHSKESATALSKLGYYTFVADIYGIDKRPTNPQEAGKIAGHFKTNYKEYQHRIQLALEQLIKSGANPKEIAVIGYCFGGSGALEAARANMPVKGVVSFHGGLGKDTARPTETIHPKVLVLHGADDFYVPEAEIKAFQDEMRAAKADWQMVYYADAVHAFTHKDAGSDKSKGTAYNEKADKRSWLAMLDFFNEIFK
ncbi:dienelactone hydrolase family protein [Flavobacterium suncheonense]|uniref:Dienelactone hydrolase n=1 Tax=Flavobacterium suncheonense GH29-5 = DSM 17707 TaxID=1121899 RepID=A0A0A2MCX4_9FLAO|nr:dienelactone hydrolase family protein [Flavobacterium suncheonense]KGO89476.1 dienelactone hydrolase [Flavobacterium suncheonense GH29-5 = DSM 17707]